MKVKGRKGLGKSRERWQVRRKKGKEGGREEGGKREGRKAGRNSTCGSHSKTKLRMSRSNMSTAGVSASARQRGSSVHCARFRL